MSTITFSDGASFNVGGPFRIERRSDGLYVVGENMLVPIKDDAEGAAIIADQNARAIRNRMQQHAFAEWDTGGGCKAWGRKTSPHSHIWISYEEASLFGPPDATLWMVGHYHADGRQLAFIEGLTLDGAIAEAGVMLQGGEPRSAEVENLRGIIARYLDTETAYNSSDPDDAPSGERT